LITGQCRVENKLSNNRNIFCSTPNTIKSLAIFKIQFFAHVLLQRTSKNKPNRAQNQIVMIFKNLPFTHKIIAPIYLPQKNAEERRLNLILITTLNIFNYLMEEFKYSELTEKIIAGFYEVYRELGFGFLESVYQNALYYSLKDKGLNVEAQKTIEVSFKNRTVGVFRADLVIQNSVIVEIKAGKALNDSHYAQILNYLKATKTEVGLLVNFGSELEFKRFALSQ
jgi:GxxExxY protein